MKELIYTEITIYLEGNEVSSEIRSVVRIVEHETEDYYFIDDKRISKSKMIIPVFNNQQNPILKNGLRMMCYFEMTKELSKQIVEEKAKDLAKDYLTNQIEFTSVLFNHLSNL